MADTEEQQSWYQTIFNNISAYKFIIGTVVLIIIILVIGWYYGWFNSKKSKKKKSSEDDDDDSQEKEEIDSLINSINDKQSDE